jgi:hypothetical protein
LLLWLIDADVFQLPQLHKHLNVTSHITLTAPNYKTVDKILSTAEFLSFEEAARRFCIFIETEQSDNLKEFLLSAQRHLLILYTVGFNIPDISVEGDIDFDTDIPNGEKKNILKFISDRVPFSYYWAVLNPVDINDTVETGVGDLIDDLGDMYNDIKRGLTLLDKEELSAKESAVWRFKFDYDNHWGEHCIEALYAIHHYLYANR